MLLFGKRLWIFLLLILIISGFLRIYALHLVPPGISDDEVFAAYNAYSLISTGKDVAGQPWYKSLLIVPYRYSQSELQAFFHLPTVAIFGLSPFSVRLTNAVLGVFSILLMYHFVKTISKSEKIALLSALVLSISPWHLIATRTAFEMPMAFTLILLSLNLMLKLSRRFLLVSIIPIAGAFLTYDGIKALFLPLIGVTASLRWDEKASKKDIYFFIASGAAFFIFIFLVFVRFSSAADRLNEISFISFPESVAILKKERAESLAPIEITKFFTNRGVILVKKLGDNFINHFSSQLLFIGGDGSIQHSVWVHGLLYTLDAIFLILGLYYLVRYSKKLLLFAGLFFLTGAIPGIVSSIGQAYVLRSMLTLIIFCLLVSCGLYYMKLLIQRIPGRRAVIGSVCFLYAILVVNFLFIYFFRYPSFGAAGLFTGERLLEQYIQHVPVSEKVAVLANGPLTHFLQFAFYTRLDPVEVQKQWYNRTFEVGKISFIEDCKEIKDASLIILHRDKFPCGENPTTDLARLQDGFDTWIIEGDKICAPYSIVQNQYQIPRTWEQFSTLEASTLPDLCKNWFFKKV